MKLIRLIICLCCVSVVCAQWTEPVPIEPQPGGSCRDPWISNDGLRLYGASLDPLFVMTRAAVDSPWSEPELLPPHLDVTLSQRSPCESPAGDTLYFVSQERPVEGSYGGYDIYYTMLTDTGWGPVFNAGPEINTQYSEYSVGISRDGSILLVASCRPGTIGAELYYHEKQPDGSWGPYNEFGPQVSDINRGEEHPCLSPDNNKLYFYRRGANLGDIYVSENIAGVWQEAVPLPYPVNESDVYDRDPCIGPDGRTLWYMRNHSFETPRWFISTDTTVTSVIEVSPSSHSNAPSIDIGYGSNGMITLFLSGVGSTVRADVVLYDLLGRKVMQDQVLCSPSSTGSSGTLNPLNLPSGFYIISVHTRQQTLNAKYFKIH